MTMPPTAPGHTEAPPPLDLEGMQGGQLCTGTWTWVALYSCEGAARVSRCQHEAVDPRATLFLGTQSPRLLPAGVSAAMQLCAGVAIIVPLFPKTRITGHVDP